MAGKVKGIEIEIGGNTKGLSKALDDVKKDTNSIQKELREVERLLKLDPKNTELLAQKQKLLSEQIETTSSKLDALKAAKKKCDDDMQNGTEVNEKQYRLLQREIIQTEQDLKKLTRAATQASSKLNGISEAAEKIGKKSTELGKKVAVVSGGAATVLGGGIALASKFEDAFAKVLTIADTTETSADDLKKAIKDLSSQTGIAATDIADNVYNAISAGQKTGDAVNFVNSATRLAKAGFADSSAALDILTTAMNAYGLETSEVSRVSDLLIGTQNLGKTTVAELSSAMGKVIPTAKANSVELNQLCTGYAILTANGIATAESTTYMNAMLNELGKGGTNVDKILRTKTGKSFAQLSEQGSTLGDVLQILNEHAKKNNQSFGDIWSSSEAGKAGLVLLGEGADTFNFKLAEMNAQSGATDSALEKLNTNSDKTRIAVNELKNAASDLGENALTALQPIIASVTNAVRDFSGWFSSLSDNTKTVIAVVVAVIAALAPALVIFGQLCTAISVATKAFGLFNAVAAANPIALIVAAIAALVAAFMVLWNKSESFRNFWIGLWENIKTVCSVALNGVVDFFTVKMPSAFNAVLDFVKNHWQQILLFITNPIAGAISFLYTFNPKFKAWVDNVVQSIKAWFGNIKDAGKSIVTGLWEGISGSWTWLTTKIKQWCGNILDNIKAFFGIHSPSRVMRDEVGRMLVEGIAVGIKENSKEVSDEFKKLLDDLKLQKELNAIDEATYYKELEKLRDRYLDKGTSDWWTYTKEIIKYESELKSNVLKTYDDIADAASKKMQDVQQKQQSLLDSLKSDKMYSTISMGADDGTEDAVILKNWDADIAFIEDYENKLAAASERLKTLFGDDVEGYAEMMDMLRSDPHGEGGKLLELMLSGSDTALEKFVSGFQEYNKKIAHFAESAYKTEVENIQTGFIDEITDALEGLPEEFKDTGETAAQFFGDGFMEKMVAIFDGIKKVMAVELGSLSMPELPGGLRNIGTVITNSNNKTQTFTFNNNGGGTDSDALANKKMLNRLILQGVL